MNSNAKNNINNNININMNNNMNNNFNPNAMIPPPFFFNPGNVNYNPNPSSFILKSLKVLQNGDDMDIMNELINLSDQLSLSDGIIGTNPNLGKLLEEICKNLEKSYLPELIIYSLQCMNYILDLNPRLSNILRKNSIITKLITIINTMEDITCLDSIVLVFEKVSLNDSLLLLENNVFLTLLNIFDFLGKSQRNSVIKCCLNMSYNILNYKQFDIYIKPASSILCNLLQYQEGVTDNHLLEKIVDIYYNIINNLKESLKYDGPLLFQYEEELVKDNYFKNFCDILTKYFIERDKNITPELVKKILNNIKIVCGLSCLAVDKYLSINLLPILVEIINYEFSNNQINTNNISIPENYTTDNTNSNFLTELFSVLVSLFPPIDEETKTYDNIKILSKQNKKYYDYFCKEIFKTLVSFIMTKSACSNLENLMQLILVFIQTTDKENIIACIDSKPIAQIIGKLLDTKYYVYLNDLSTLLDILMTKAPNFYLNNFIREGIIDNIQSYLADINLEIIDDIDNKLDENKDKEKDIEEKDSFKDIIAKIKKGENKLELLDKLLLLDEQSFNKKKEEYISDQKILTQKKMRQIYEKYFTPKKLEEYAKTNSSSQGLINLKEVLASLENDLISACSDFNDNNNKEKALQSIKAIIDILTNPSNEITFFELESSKILLGLCYFLEPQFFTLYNKLDFQKDNELQKNIDLNDILPFPLKYNINIFENVKLFLQNFTQENLIDFVKLLVYSITSMNCFTMVVDDAQNNNINYWYNQVNLLSKRFNIKVYYNDSNYKSFIMNNAFIHDNDFKAKCSEYNFAFKSVGEYQFLLINTFEDLSSYLLSNINVPYVYNENYEIIFDYFLDLNGNNIKEKFRIENKWGIADIKRALIEKYGQKTGESFFGVPIYFGINYKMKNRGNINLDITLKDNIDSNGFRELIINNLGLDVVNFNNINKQILEFDKIGFIKDYHNSILFSKSLYEIKRLMPTLFILSILNLSIKKYPKLFNIEQNIFKTKYEMEELFTNPKVSLLITKSAGDAYSVSKSNLPSWCKNITLDCGFLSKFDSRQLIFKVSFEPKRSLINLQNYLKTVDPNYHSENITLEKSMRLKIIVERDSIINYGLKLLDNPVTSRFKGYLEFEYMGEIGNGLGPTLEFYRLIIEKLYGNKQLWYKTTDNTIYPAIGLNNDKNSLILFKLLGFIIGRAIYDDRLVDFPLSKVFWNILLNRSVKLSDISFIDKDLYKFIEDILVLINKKRELLEQDKNISEEDLENKVLYNGSKLSTADIYFTFPGYDIELKKGGKNILLCIKNIEEYVNLIYDFIFYKGINNVTESFREGFNIIININELKCFTADELEEIILGSDKQKWDSEVLYENLKPEHGYNKNSKTFKDLIKYMSSLNKDEQKQFLIFATGASRLPLGGFKALNPKLTVVKKSMNGNDNPDKFLPTVMTCQNYLKIPEYSCYDVLKEKFNLAMNEGGNEFHLS